MCTAPPSPRRRIVVVGVTGPSCAGKTTLCQQLQDLLPDCRVVKQDDYRTPNKATLHPIWRVPDREDAEHAVDWMAWRTAVEDAIAEAASDAEKPGPLTIAKVQSEVPLDDLEALAAFDFGTLAPQQAAGKTPAERLQDRSQGDIFVLLEGRLALYEPSVARKCHVCLFLRLEEQELRRRWIERDQHGSPSSPSSSSFFRRMVHPAHQRAHAHLFINGDVERGYPNDIYHVRLVVGSQQVLERACQIILDETR